MTILLDSVIVIDYLNAIPQARAYVGANVDEATISVVTFAEVLVGIDDAGVPDVVRFLESFPLLTIDQDVAFEAARLRRQFRWRLPDAFQAALAQRHGLRLSTRNTNDFDPAVHPFVKVPYIL